MTGYDGHASAVHWCRKSDARIKQSGNALFCDISFEDLFKSVFILIFVMDANRSLRQIMHHIRAKKHVHSPVSVFIRIFLPNPAYHGRHRKH